MGNVATAQAWAAGMDNTLTQQTVIVIATWSIPGATLAADPQLARQLGDTIPGLELDAVAHLQEHAIEVELPFPARLAPQSKVVGIAIGAGDLATCGRFVEGLPGAAAAGDFQ